MVTTSGSIKLEELSQRCLVTFERRYGIGALDFACHLAFPLTLTTDLSYCLRETFFPDSPWHWAAEVLLSGLCSPAGYDLYEMEGATRKALLHRLLERFKEPRLWRLDQFMKAYLKHRLDVKPLEADRLWLLGDRPHWTALACLRPDEAFAAIQQDLQQLVVTDDFQDRFRLAALIERYADLLTQKNFRPVLLEYAKRARAGEPIDPTVTTAAAARQAGFPLERLEFDVVTIVFEDQEVSPINVADLAIVVNDILPYQVGRISFRSSWWPALCPQNVRILSGTIVRVVGRSGITLLVEPDLPDDDALRPFDFKIVTVNQKGEVVQRLQQQAFYFVELLPSSYNSEPLPDDLTESSTGSGDRSFKVAQISVEMKRLGWTTEQGRGYLKRTYGKRSRQELDDLELMSFLSFLESQSSPSPLF